MVKAFETVEREVLRIRIRIIICHLTLYGTNYSLCQHPPEGGGV